MDHLHAKRRIFFFVFNAIKFMNRTNNGSTMFYELCYSPQYKNVFGNVKKHIFFGSFLIVYATIHPSCWWIGEGRKNKKIFHQIPQSNCQFFQPSVTWLNSRLAQYSIYRTIDYISVVSCISAPTHKKRLKNIKQKSEPLTS